MSAEPADAARRTLAGRRVVVVGASAGIGRAIASRAMHDGASVVVAARRQEPLDTLVRAASGGVAVACDVCTEPGRAALAATVASHLGGADLVIVSIGVAPLTFLDQADDEQWAATFATNVVAVSGVIRALAPHCADGAIVAVLSSEAVGQNRSALGIYAASKAALDQALEAWRVERPDLRFTRVVVGSTIDTEFGAGFPDGLLGWALQDWQARGLLPATYLVSDDVAEAVVGALASASALRDVSLDSLTVRPSAPASVARARPAGTGPTDTG